MVQNRAFEVTTLDTSSGPGEGYPTITRARPGKVAVRHECVDGQREQDEDHEEVRWPDQPEE